MNLLTRARALAVSTSSGCLPRLRSALTLRSMLAATAALVAASCLAVIGVGGSYAFLNSRAPIATGTLQSGTAALSITSVLSLPTTGMYPGQTVSGAASVANAGNVPLAVQLSSLTPPTAGSALSSSLTIGLSVVATTAACTGATPPTPTWTGTFAAATPGPLGSTLTVNGTMIVCVSVTLAAAAPAALQGQTANGFGIVLNGTQA